MSTAIPKPTETELEILQLLWQNGPSTVKFINQEQNKLKTTGYTTTLKIMQIMLEKKLLSREDSARQHVYKAAISEERTQKQLLGQFLESAFRGSATNLVMQALGNHKTSPEELKQIRELLDKLQQPEK
jgi:BlaI family penicillinase repressor